MLEQEGKYPVDKERLISLIMIGTRIDDKSLSVRR